MFVLFVHCKKIIRNYALYFFSDEENTCETPQRYFFTKGTNLWTSIFEKCAKTEIDFRLNFYSKKKYKLCTLF